MIAAKPNPRAHLTRPTPRLASRFAKRKLVPGFLRCAPRARAWSRCSQVADLHQGNRLHRYETAPGCVVAPNKPDEDFRCKALRKWKGELNRVAELMRGGVRDAAADYSAFIEGNLNGKYLYGFDQGYGSGAAQVANMAGDGLASVSASVASSGNLTAASYTLGASVHMTQLSGVGNMIIGAGMIREGDTVGGSANIANGAITTGWSIGTLNGRPPGALASRAMGYGALAEYYAAPLIRFFGALIVSEHMSRDLQRANQVLDTQMAKVNEVSAEMDRLGCDP